MITLTFNTEDLTRLRFAHSPLFELVMSYKLLHPHPIAPPGFYHHWLEEAHQALRNTAYPYMDAVIVPYKITAEFLLTPPLTAEKEFDTAIDRLRQTPDDVIQRSIQQILCVMPLTPERDMFLHEPRTALDCLIPELVDYWQRTLAPYWGRMTAQIENEFLNRGRLLALNGAETVLDQLSYDATYTSGSLSINRRPAPLETADHTLRGSGAVLVPILFKQGSSAHIYPESQPIIIYSAPGFGLWQSAPHLQTIASLRILVGDSKARILLTLADKHIHTGELARQLHVTPSAVSQQLQQLYQTGLVEMNRVGKHVFYRLSHRGRCLLELFDE